MRLSLKIFIICFLGLSLAGCSGSATGVQKEVETVTVWHWMSDRDEVLQTLAKRFEEQHQIHVEFELYAPSEIYAQRIKASAQTNTLPDIYGILGEKRDFASFIKSGYVADLTEDLTAKDTAGSSWKESLFEKALAVNEFSPDNEYGVKPGFYGIPIDVTTIQMVYNKKLYQKAGLDPEKPPLTLDDFIRHTRVLKDKGIPRFVSGFGEIWMIDALASNFAMNIMGEEKVFDTYRGKVPYTDPDWVKVLSLFKQLSDEKVFVDGVVTMVNKTAEQTFANERATYAFNGSWCVNVYRGMNPNLEYGAILPPKVSLHHPMKVWGGAGGSFVVNAQSPHKKAAIQFLKWLTEGEQQAYLSGETQNLPSSRTAMTKISPLLAQFSGSVDSTTHPNIYPVREESVVTEAFDKGIQSILIGEKTPQQIAQEVQKTKAKEMKKKESAKP